MTAIRFFTDEDVYGTAARVLRSRVRRGLNSGSGAPWVSRTSRNLNGPKPKAASRCSMWLILRRCMASGCDKDGITAASYFRINGRSGICYDACSSWLMRLMPRRCATGLSLEQLVSGIRPMQPPKRHAHASPAGSQTRRGKTTTIGMEK